MAEDTQFLQGFGRSLEQVMKDQGVITPLVEYLNAASDKLVKLMTDKIQDEGANANGVLSAGLSYLPEQKDGVLESTFYSEEDYVNFRNDGVSGRERPRDTEYQFKATHPSRQMVQDIAQWLNAKGYEDDNIQGQEWVVATNVLKYGYDGARFIEHAFSDSNLDQMNNDILVVIANTTDGIMKRVIPEFK